jgi:hypothetical protein
MFTLGVTPAPDGRFRRTPDNPVFAEQMAIAEGIMRADRDMLNALPKQ